MRGAESEQQVLFSYVAIDARIPADHPLRTMKHLLEPVLAELAPRFATMYADGGRPSIPITWSVADPVTVQPSDSSSPYDSARRYRLLHRVAGPCLA